MASIKETKRGHEYRVAVLGGQIFKIYDGEGRGSDISEENPDARRQFVDKVMGKIGDSFPFEIIEGGKTEEM